jgi:dienelactone hydrolase
VSAVLERVDYADGTQRLAGWLARPASRARAAILVYPTIANLNPAVERRARMLAEAGYLALIADFYGEPVADFHHAQELGKALRGNAARYRARLTAPRSPWR